MITATANFQAYEEADSAPKFGEIKPIHIFSLERRPFNEGTVAISSRR
jgi:hypothetical protein